MATVPLDGPGWRLRGFLGEDWRLQGAHRAGPVPDRQWVPAEVPGSVLDALVRAGEAADPYHGRQSLLAEWVPQRSWVYRRSFAADPMPAGGRAFLQLDGLDPGGTVFLDGRELVRHEGMHLPCSVEVTELLGGPGRSGPGRHTVAVVVDPAPVSEPQVGRTSRVTVHKGRMGYGWDFCPRIVHQGLWQSARVRVTGPVRIADVWARPRVDPAGPSAEVAVRVTLDTRGEQAHEVVATLLDAAGAVVTSAAVTAGAGDGGPVRADLCLPVPAPRLWWPNGMGRQHLYRLRVAVSGRAGHSDATETPVGLRTLGFAANDGAPPSALPYTLEVNGRRAYLKGWNWVPVDALYGVPRPDRLEHLLTLARDAGVNLLRVWGGGLIETPEFYRLADRLGLLVWQEFAQSSSIVDSTPSAEEGFVRRMAAEAEHIVPLRRNHPSLAVWCGGNELQRPDGRPLDEGAPVLAALRDAVRRLDPDRHWLPTSPSGPRFLNRPDVVAADPDGQHDVHGPWEHQGLAGHYRCYDGGTSLLLSEFGVEGMAHERMVEATVPESSRRLPTRGDPVWDHLGRWWNNEALVQESFGSVLRDLPGLSRASQFLQADGLRYAVEANRRRAYRSAGTIPWQLNEPFPNGWCTAAVDHSGEPKPAYHWVRRAYRRRHVCARLAAPVWTGPDPFRTEAWAWSDDDPAVPAVVTARVVTLDGTVLASREWTVRLSAAGPVGAGSIGCELGTARPALFVLDLDLRVAGEAPVGNRYLLSGGPDFAALLDLPPATVHAELTADGDAWTVLLRHAGGPAAPFLRLLDARPVSAPGWAVWDDNAVDLLPGEARTLRGTWRGAPAAGRQVALDGWNVPRRLLRVDEP
jgi:beta-mannosidase